MLFIASKSSSTARSNRSQMFFKIGVLKNIYCEIFKNRAPHCFIEHLLWLLQHCLVLATNTAVNRLCKYPKTFYVTKNLAHKCAVNTVFVVELCFCFQFFNFSFLLI